MLNRIIFFILLVLWSNTSLSQNPVVIGQQKVVYSNVLKEDRTYQIYLPQSYNWAVNRYYPVLYVLDGESTFIHTMASVDFLSSTSEIPELIVVAITSTVRVRDFTQSDWSSHWIGGGGANNFKSFLSKELIPEIEKNYRTNKFRILSGISAGGQFVLYTLSSEPSLFNAYISISPSLDWDNNLPQRSLDESFEHTDSLKAFLYFAWSDDFGEALAEDQRLLETLETKSPQKFRWIGKGYPDETHVSIALLAQIDALRQVYAGYRLHNDLLVNGFNFAEKHFEEVSNKVGYNIPVPEDIINNFGYDALNNGNIKEAMDFFKRNIDENPNSANAFDSMADAYEEAGLWDEALKSSERAVELANKYGDPGLSKFIKHSNKIKEKNKPSEK
jgi:uncharacterized protein